MNRRLSTLLIVALALVLVGSLLAWYVQTNRGTVRIIDVRFMGSNGVPMSGLLYIPSNATAKTPAPGIVAIHGYINSRETQDGFAIEFARRGFVVLAADQTGHGYSGTPAFANGFGGPDALAYLRTLDIVDKNNVGLEGHSMGGWASLIAAGVLKDQYQSIVVEGSSTGTFGAPDGTAQWPRNMALVFSKYDEFSLLMWGAPKAADINQTDKLKTVFGTTETVQVGKVYGDISAGTARVLYQPAITHPMDHFNNQAIGYAIDWFGQTLKGGNGLPSSNQIWFWKEFGELIAFIGLILSFFPLGGLLLNTAYFAKLKKPLPAPKTVTGWGWWLAAAITVAVPALTFFKFNHLADAPWAATPLFSQNITTGILFWALGNAAISLVLFLLWHFLANRKNGAGADNYGLTSNLKIDWSEIGKSLLLAALIAFIGMLILYMMDFFFKVDFRFWIVALKPMNSLQFRIFLGYLIPFAIYFLILATVLHGQMRRVQKNGKDISLSSALLINIALMILGIVILLVYEYGTLFTTGALPNPTSPESLLAIIAIQFVPILAIVALISTYFFYKTGRIYVGAFLNTIFVVWYIVAGQAIHWPF
jgi:pimeloyl-ACP methyl ester carboxylesterase